MANVLSNLAGDIYVAADVVGRELSGAVTSVTLNANDSERVAVGDTVRSHFTRPATSVDNTPSMTIPEGNDQTVDSKIATITKSKGVQVPWTGEDVRRVNNGSGFSTIYGDQIAQAMRALVNEMEVDTMTEAYRNASRVVGTAGTTPFASNFDIVAEARQILVDNGAPEGDTSMIINTLAGTKLRNLAQLQKASEAGTDTLARQGVLLDLQGLAMKESAGVQTHTKGTGAGYLVNGALAVGATAITVDTGTGTVVAGDVITFTDDTVNSYVVSSALAGGVITIAEPGLRVAIPDNNAITVGNNYAGNVAFHRNAIELIVRPPSVPIVAGNASDAAIDAITVQDPRTGLVFEIRAYVGFQKAMFNVTAAWGVKAWMPKYIAGIRG